MLSTTVPLLLSLLALSTPLHAAAIPAPSKTLNQPRAGGPAFSPIPSTCPVYNVLPVALYSNSSSYAPAASIASDLVYSAYYPPPTTNDTQAYVGCLEQCNGFEGCVAAYIAWNVPTPKGYYGTAGGQLMTACLFYNRTLTAADFEVAAAGTHTDAKMGNLSCK